MILPLLLTLATTVTLQQNGVPVERGEVCRFAALDGENPFQRWLAGQDVVCVAAGGELELPPGLWNVFARSGDGVSATPLLVDGAAPPRSLSLALDPAGAIAPLLPAGRHGVIYVPRRGSAIPVGGMQRVLVPAGEALWLFVVEKSVPVAVFSIGPLGPGELRRVDAQDEGAPAVIGWLRVPEEDRTAIAEARGLSPPSIRATAGQTAREAEPLPPFDILHGAFIRAGSLPAGDGELTIDGRGWVPERRRLRVQPGLTLVADALNARAAGRLVVNWGADRGAPDLERSLGSCDSPRKRPLFELTVSACPPPERRGAPVDPAACSVVRQETYEPEMVMGSVSLDDIPPGLYRTELRLGVLPPVSIVTPVRAAQQGLAPLFASYIEIYGSVTHGGEAIEEAVAIEFPGGYGFAPRGAAEYRAALLAPLPTDAPITVAACDGAPRAVVLVDQVMRRNARFNIDIPGNEITISVTDTFTREPLGSAIVRFTAMAKSNRPPRRPVMNRTVTTDRSGKAVIVAVPERDIHLDVSNAGYEKQRVATFTMGKSEKKSVDVELVPLRGTRGRILSDREFESAAVFWHSPSGTERERAELSPDGTFVYGGAHGPEETMSVVSQSHPLWVFRAPALERRQTINLRFPDGPVRSFETLVTGADGRESRHVGIAIGGVAVPQPVLRQHQFLRGQSATIRGSGPLLLRYIA